MLVAHLPAHLREEFAFGRRQAAHAARRDLVEDAVNFRLDAIAVRRSRLDAGIAATRPPRPWRRHRSRALPPPPPAPAPPPQSPAPPAPPTPPADTVT